MGQYYSALLADRNFEVFTVSPCAKLTEHSWVGNGFVNTVLNNLLNTRARVAWWGDYGTDYYDAKGRNNKFVENLSGICETYWNKKAKSANQKLPELVFDEYVRRYLVEGLCKTIHMTEKVVDYKWHEDTEVEQFKGKGFDHRAHGMRFHLVQDGEELFPDSSYYIVNFTKQQYIDMDEYIKECTDSDGWCIHPLPLLTSVGNGKGGGDFYGYNKCYCGIWALDMIGAFFKNDYNIDLSLFEKFDIRFYGPVF